KKKAAATFPGCGTIARLLFILLPLVWSSLCLCASVVNNNMKTTTHFAWFLAIAPLLVAWVPGCARPLAQADMPLRRVASKMSTESALLGEVLAHLARDAGAEAEHKARLGDTLVAWSKLLVGDIDVYCEYTGTLTQEILAKEKVSGDEAIQASLAGKG